jgi:hypothetical protein
MLPNKEGVGSFVGIHPARSSSLAIEKGFIASKPGSRIMQC